ncbi:MAG: HlyD family secretion protein [Pseudomonadota bacterium]|nr:HlyD family secretion protein [Pseudomonadota bacterium]
MLYIRLALTSALVALAILGAAQVWQAWSRDAWTRDGRVQADVISLAAETAGRVVAVHAVENGAVAAGDVLVEIDPRSYRLAEARAEAAVAAARAAVARARVDAERFDRLAAQGSAAVSEADRERADAALAAAEAEAAGATAALEEARLALERTRLRAPADGVVANLRLRPGDYATPGATLLAMVETGSFRVQAYFLETKLPGIRPGAPARIRLMSGGPVLTGHVQGLAPAIADAADPDAPSGLAAPEASFEWVRLARRTPVRIALDPPPPGVTLVAGMTASVIVEAADR